MFHLSQASHNKKTGFMPVSTSGRDTCPDACPLKGHGCYAGVGMLRFHWNKVSDGRTGDSWKDFLEKIHDLPKNILWRHNQAGDLIGENNIINVKALRELIHANKGKKGYTYTHYPLTENNIAAIRESNEKGFTISISCNSIEDIHIPMEMNLPTVCILPFKEGGYSEKILKDSKGNKVKICPSQLDPKMTCAKCGICQKNNRKFAIGFIAHGLCKKHMLKDN